MTSEGVQTVPPSSKIAVDQGIQDNILDLFDLPTYHFRLYMMSDDAIRKNIFGPRAKEQRVIIAESGVTSIEIDEIEVKTVSGISRTAGIGTATEFSIGLKEPFGATMLDQISNAAKFLDIKNFAKVPFFLELSFRGRKAGDGQKQQAGSIGELADLVWTWPIILTKMAMDVSTGGTVYQIQAAIYGDLAYTNQISDAQKPMTIAASTAGEFFTEYEKQMNDNAEKKQGTAKYTEADKFKFIIDEEIAKAKIVPDLLEDREGRSASMESKDGKIVFTFQPPISVDRVVENVLSLTELFHKNLTGDEADTTPVLYRLIADTVMGEYDTTRSDYQRTYRYLIIQYNQETLTTPATQNTTKTDDELYTDIVKQGRIRKLYNYIYTGLNDQVLDFELVFNFNWYAALPLQDGQSTNPANAEPKAVLSNDQREKSSTNADKINKFRSFRANPAGFAPFSFFEDALSEFLAPLTDIQTEINEVSDDVSEVIGDAIADANEATSTVQSGIEGVTENVPGIVVPGVASIVPTFTTAPIGDTPILTRLLSTTQKPRVAPITTASASAAQDNLREQDIFLDDPRIGEKNNKILKQSLAESKSGDNSADVAQGSQTSNRTMLSAMFEQARSPVTGDLLSIELNIKGDPYWLEPPPIHRNGAPRSTLTRMLVDRQRQQKAKDEDLEGAETIPNDADQNIATANASDSQTFMVFRSFTPLEFDPETGLTPAGKKSNNVLNGVYAVRMVTHSFSGGAFTQTLHGIRNPNIDLANVNLLAHLGVSEGENPLNDNPEETGDESTTQRTDQETAVDAQGAANVDEEGN